MPTVLQASDARMSLITYQTRIHFADRVLEDALPEAMRHLAVRRPLVLVDDDGRAGEAVARLEDAWPADGAATPFADISDDPPPDVFERAERAFRRTGSDGLVALGGTAALDLARILATGEDGRARPLIAIPTTAAGVGLGPICTGRFAGAQRAALPDAILCDPTLLLAVDGAAMAWQGFDALSHCIEAYLATAYNPPADGIALEGIHRAALSLERAVGDAGDLEARREMLAVALNAGLAAQKGLGGIEALARAVAAECGLVGRHGMLQAALMRPVLTFNAPAVGDRFARIAEAMRLSVGADLAIDVATLGVRLGLPGRLDMLARGGDRLTQIANRAAADPASRTNPRHVTPADYLELLEQAL